MKRVKINILRIAVIVASLLILILLVSWLPKVADDLAITAPEFKSLKIPLLLQR